MTDEFKDSCQQVISAIHNFEHNVKDIYLKKRLIDDIQRYRNYMKKDYNKVIIIKRKCKLVF